MAEQERQNRQDRNQEDRPGHKKNRRGYLRDFVKGSDGSYAYTGKTWHADPAQRRRVLRKLWVLQAVMLLSVLLPGFVTTAGLLNTFYVILPYVFWFLSDIVLTYTLGDMTFGGNPLRDYVYERSVTQYALRSMFPLAGAALMAVMLLLFFLRGGNGEGGILCLACCLIQAAASVCGRKSGVAGLWTEVDR